MNFNSKLFYFNKKKSLSANSIRRVIDFCFFLKAILENDHYIRNEGVEKLASRFQVV